MNTGQIKKSKQAAKFTVIPNAILEDKNLSLKAIGLLCYLLRLPADWAINKTSLHKYLKDGRDAVLAAFKELEDFGYIEAEEIREKGRFVGFNYEVSDFPKKTDIKPDEFSENPLPEKPITENPESVAPITENPITVNPISGKPISENPELLKTDFHKDEVTKDEESKDESAAGSNLFGENLVKSKKKKAIQEAPPEIVLPWKSEVFKAAWVNWKAYRKGEHSFNYKTPQSQQAALNDLANLSEGVECKAIELINHAMGKGWKGIYPIKHENNENGNFKNGTGNHFTGGNDTGSTPPGAGFASYANSTFSKYGKGGND